LLGYNNYCHLRFLINMGMWFEPRGHTSWFWRPPSWHVRSFFFCLGDSYCSFPFSVSPSLNSWRDSI
jgi:hypothetical protein